MRLTLEQKMKMCEEHVIKGKSISEASEMYGGYRTSEYIKKYILAYNEVSNMKIENIRNNFNGYISLIDKFEEQLFRPIFE
jgi:hypothetical protein